MPLRATRPVVLPEISTPPAGDLCGTARFVGSLVARTLAPVARSNW